MIPDLNARMAASQDESEGLLNRRDAAATDPFFRGIFGHPPPQSLAGTSIASSSSTCTTRLGSTAVVPIGPPGVVVQTVPTSSSSTCTSAKTSSSSTCTTTTSSPVHSSTMCTATTTPSPVHTSTTCTPSKTIAASSSAAVTHTSTPCTTKTSSSGVHTSTTCTSTSSKIDTRSSTTCTAKSSVLATHSNTTCTTSMKTSTHSSSTCTTRPTLTTAKATSTCTSSHTTDTCTLPHSTVVAPFKSTGTVVPVLRNKCPSCPRANNTIYRDQSKIAYNIRCNADNSAESYHTLSVGAGGYSQCFSWCSADKTCSGFTFSGGDGGSCYYKKNLPSKLYVNKRLDNYITCAKQGHLARRQLPYLDSNSHFVETLSVIALMVFLIGGFLIWLRKRRSAQSKDYVRSHAQRRSVSNSSDEHAPIALPFHEMAGADGFVAVPPYGSAYAVKHAKKDSQGNSVSVQPQPAQHHARQRSIYRGDGGVL